MVTIRRRDDRQLDASGQVARVIGWHATESGELTKTKFRCGSDVTEAKRRIHCLEEAWQRIVASYGDSTLQPRWDRDTLPIARALSKGDKTFEVGRQMFGSHGLYLGHLLKLNTIFGGAIQLVPRDEEWFVNGVAGEQQKIVTAQAIIDASQERLQSVGKAVGRSVARKGGPTFYEALKAFGEALKTEPKLFDPNTGEPKAWFFKRIQLHERLQEHHPDFYLTELDHEKLDTITKYWRGRPKVKSRGTTMSVEAVEKTIGEFWRFAKWLHLSKQFPWRLPEDWQFIKKTVEATADEIAERCDTEQVDTFTPDELRKILPFTSGVSRAMFLLGLNCGFGGGECGTLTAREVHLHKAHPKAAKMGILSTDADSWIRRIRRKNLVYGEHQLWPETVEALEWLIARRKKMGGYTPDSLLFVTEDGLPMWKLTKGGNNGQQFQNMWADVVKHPEGVRRLSLGKLRKTAGDMIKAIADGEVSGVFLHHGKPVKTDDLSDIYTNRHFDKVFMAQREAHKRFKLFEPIAKST